MHVPVHFISGLPRSGRMLLSALLRRNPRFHADARNTLLSPDLFQRFANDAFWCDPRRLPEGLHIV